MKKRKVKRIAAEKPHSAGPMIGRGAGMNYAALKGAVMCMLCPDEMDDVSDWAKDAAKKLIRRK